MRSCSKCLFGKDFKTEESAIALLFLIVSNTNLLIVYKDLMIDSVYAGKNAILYIQPFGYTIFY